jgi:hypothetical protein
MQYHKTIVETKIVVCFNDLCEIVNHSNLVKITVYILFALPVFFGFEVTTRAYQATTKHFNVLLYQ